MEGDTNANAVLREAMPFVALVGIEGLAASREEVRARLAWSPERGTSGGMMHGGAIMTLADACGGACAYLNLPEGAAGTATVQSATNFLRPLRSGAATAVSRPLHIGRSFITVETDVRDDDGRLLARVTQTQAVLHGDRAPRG